MNAVREAQEPDGLGVEADAGGRGGSVPCAHLHTVGVFVGSWFLKCTDCGKVLELEA